MRKIRLLPAAFALVIVFLASCTKTDMNTISISEAESIIPGSYKVNMYDNASGNTTAYDNYTFDFQSNGALIATNGIETYTGQWSIVSVNEADFDKQVTITISGNADMDALNHAWFVEEVSDVTLYLTNQAGDETVHFIKS